METYESFQGEKSDRPLPPGWDPRSPAAAGLRRDRFYATYEIHGLDLVGDLNADTPKRPCAHPVP